MQRTLLQLTSGRNLCAGTVTACGEERVEEAEGEGEGRETETETETERLRKGGGRERLKVNA